MGVDFGHRIKELREKMKFTQAELAKLCGLGESTISFYEKGKREPNYEVLLCLAKKLNTNPNYLLTGKDSYWWESDDAPTEIDLEQFIKEQPNLRIFGDPLNEDAKSDVMLALRTVWEVLKKERAAQRQHKGK